MMMRKLFGMVLCLVLSVVAFGQNATTSVRGTITDSTGAVVQGATVTLTNVTTRTSQEQKVGKNGDYNFVDLQPATYTISVAYTGFGTQTKDTELLVSQPATINFKLTIGSTAQTVEVTASSTLNFTDASIGNAISSAQIESMPIDSRNVADLLSLQPGVLYFGNNNSASNPAATQDSRLGAVAGARSDQGNITLDGLDDNDQTFGYAFTGVLRSTLDSTQEYRVITANSNADAGRSSGAQVTLVTKSGTNRFHGSAYEYYRNRYFAANDWFTKQAEAKTGQPNKPGQLTRNTFGGTIGGPILKDKVFFFFNYEGQRTRESSTVTQEVPTALYRTGTLQYKDTSGAVRTLSPAQVAALDAPCTSNGVCPNGPGPNAAILAYFAQLPVANGLTIGDSLNEGSFAFSSPTPYSHNTSIIKFDWTPTAAHHVFVRGNLQKDVIASTQQFPGLPPSTTTEDNTKGMAAGDTWVINSNLVNDIRYGYTRQGFAQAGVGTGSYTDLRFIATPTAETRTTIRSVPINSILDSLNYTRGSHSIQVGGTWRLIHNNSQTNANSFNSGSSNPLGLTTANLPQPTSLPGYTPVASNFATPYLEAYANLVGTTPVLTQNINYSVNPGGNTGTLLPQGSFITRNFIANEFEVYAQDSWRASPKLTITYGLRYSNLQTPYDKNGQSAAPTVDTHAFFQQRAIAAAAGQVYEPALAFAPNGPVYGRPGYWAKQKDNFAPRIAIAYALDPKTSIRAGAGMYYDHFGQGVVNAFNSYGSFGLASQISSALGALTTENSPRFISRTTLPNLPSTTPAATQTFPYVLPQTLAQGSSFGISWGVDNRIKTPYSEVYNVSIQRALPGGFTLEAAYVGRFGRKLMQQLDLATPVNLADPKSGASYFQAGAQLAAVVDQNGGNKNATVASIPYFENMFPQLASVSTTKCPNPTHTATQAIYCNEFTPNRGGLGETTALADLDFYCLYGCPASAPTNRFFQGQFSSLYAWSSIGTSSYNAGQFVLRHPLSHGFQGDLSYTLGNSIDLGSDAERSSEKLGGSGSYITNAWNPAQSRGVSDFDTRHLITANGSYLLPFGHGQAFGTHVNRLTDLVIGGWQFASIVRWTSGLPFSLTEGGFTTDWEIASYGVKTGNFKAKKVYNPGNIPNAFGTTLASQITSSVATGSPLERLPYPGEAGERNNFRRDGYFGADASLTKPFKITESQLLRFGWEVFNLSNSVRFNAVTGSLVSGTFGNYTSTLTTSRRMQFSLRYSF
jgi:hypothetical protein